MTDLHLDDIDKRLVNLVQAGFPLTEAPYGDLGARLGMTADAVMERITRLKTGRVIRLIGPVLDARSLGYRTTLVAMRVTGERQKEAERIIASHPGVSHGYERDHYLNIWFTLAAHATVLESELERLIGSINAEVAFPLPALRVFKLNAFFDVAENGEEAPAGSPGAPVEGVVQLSPEDRRVVNALPQDVPLVATPYLAVAEQAGMDTAELLRRCRSLVERGVIRRFGASLNHREAGFTANGMACWAVPPGLVDAVGQKLASLREVSHCYERQTNEHWRYNLFAMIHRRTRSDCEETANRIAEETGLKDYVVLFSTREFKKTRIRYRA